MKELPWLWLWLALLLFISALLSVSASQGEGPGSNAADLIRRTHGLQPNEPTFPFPSPLHDEQEKLMKMRREMGEMETNDYSDPKANVNPRSGPLFTPPTPTPPPSH